MPLHFFYISGNFVAASLFSDMEKNENRKRFFEKNKKNYDNLKINNFFLI
jgi:hypothetical protein